MSIVDNYQKLLDELSVHSDLPNLENLKIVAVSKYATAAQLIEAYEAGIREFGENKIQDVQKRFEELPREIFESIHWHFIGHLQSNKAKKAVQLKFNLIHSVDSFSLAQKISTYSEELQHKQRMLLQVNLTREPQKTGFLAEALQQEFAQIMRLPCVDVSGLMTIGPYTDDVSASLRCFADLHDLRDKLESEFQHPLPELSMGMSKDFHHAIESGATIIRIGSHLFGGYP